MEGRPFSRAPGKKGFFFILGNFYYKFERCKKGLANGQLSQKEPCWGLWRGFVSWDFWEKKEIAYLGTFVLDP